MSRLAALLLVLGSFSVFGGTPYRVRDINTSYADSPQTSYPRHFLDLGGHAVFSAATVDAGWEPWVTDGTADGTKLLLDVNPGGESSQPVFFPFGSTALFFATDATHGRELWRTDGTPQGTSLVKDIVPGSASAISVDQVVNFDGKLVFAVQAAGDGPATLWSSDGTAAGTKLFFTYHPEFGVAGRIYDLTTVNHRIVARSYDGLWSTDGAVAELLDPQPASEPVLVAGGRLFFMGSDENLNSVLYVSDGTKAGTHAVFIRSLASTPPRPGFAPAGNGVMFNAAVGTRTKIYVSDGTEGGTHPLGGFPNLDDSNDQPFFDIETFVVNGFTYFQYGNQLWRTDGTDAGTTRVAPSLAETAATGAAGNIVYITTYHTVPPTLYAYDTTTGILRGMYGSNGRPLVDGHEFAPFGNRLVFAGAQRSGDVEPWITDGTAAGTKEIVQIAANGPASSYPESLIAAGDSLIFSAAETDQRSLWITDGTEAGTTKIRETFPAPYVSEKRFSFRDHAYIKTPYELWSIDSAGHVSKQVPTPDNDGGRDLAPGPDAIYIAGNTVNMVRWDGVSRKGEPFYNTDFRDLALVGDFIGKPVLGGNHALVFMIDGKPVTLHKWPATYDVAQPLVAGGFVYVIATDHKHLEVWRSDGTPTGTRLVVTVPGVDSVTQLVKAAGTRIFFTATDAAHGRELWTTDGTADGTHITLDIAAGSASSSPAPLAQLGDRMLFTADDGTTGRELWITDGSPEGTKLVKDVFPGTSPSLIRELTVTDGLAYFIASRSEGNDSLWQSDGSNAGTRPIMDLSTGYPHRLTAAGDRLYFTNTDDAGNELWALPIDPISRLRIADLRVAEGNDAHFVVTLTHPSSRRVSVDYATSDATATAGTDYTDASGTLTFEPGETQKEIVIPTTADSIDEEYEVFRVTLFNSSSVDIDRATASAVIEGQTPDADLQIAAELHPSPNGGDTHPFVRVKNNGPATIANATMQFAFAAGSAASQTTFADLAAGAETTWPSFSTYGGSGYWWARTATIQRDSNLGNNAIIGFAARDTNTGGVLSFAPAGLHPGDTAFLEMASTSLDSSMTAVSSNPDVVAVSALTFEPTRATATLTAKSAGTATIRVAGVGDITATVLEPGASLKLLPTVTTSNTCCARAGLDYPFYISIYGLTPAGAVPSGTVTVSEGSVVRGTGTLAAGSAAVPIDVGAVGSHSYTVDYSGDANFTGGSAPVSVTTGQGNAKLALRGEVLSDGQTKITLTVSGSPLATPAGTITFTESGQPDQKLASTVLAPGVASASHTFALTPGPHTITAFYDGDGNYLPAAATITFGPHRRAAH